MKQSIAFGLEKIGAPCVLVNCKGVGLYFLIDTGSTENHLLSYTYQYFTECFDDVIKDSDGSFTITGLGGSVSSKRCTFSFFIDETPCEDSFVVLPNTQVFADLSKKLDEPIAGILGGRFLQKNNVVIDYGKQLVHIKTHRKIKTSKKAA